MDKPILDIQNLTKTYYIGTFGRDTMTAELQSFYARLRGKEDPNLKIGKVQHAKGTRFNALNDVSFQVKKGEAVGIIGHNGAGKSTLLKLISRITAPTNGSITLRGKVSSMLEVGTGFNPELTGRENTFLNGAILGMTRAEVTRKFDEIVEFAEMEKFIDMPVKRYSSGMYVKLAFAVAAHLDSEILIMDEVLAVGDMQYQQKCINKMESVVSDEGRTVLFVSHNMNSIQQLCQRTILLDHGNIQFDGATDDAIQRYMQYFNQFEPLVRLDQIARATTAQRAILQEVELIDKKSCVFHNSELLRFRLSWKSLVDLDTVSLRIIIHYMDGTAIGMAVLNRFQSVSTGKTYEREFAFDLNALPAGRYAMSIELFNSGATGSSRSLDLVSKAVVFDVLNDYQDINNWEHKWWGHTRFNDLKLID